MKKRMIAPLFVVASLLCPGATFAAGAASPSTIAVTAASYGANCKQPHGNVTRFVADDCNGKSFCNFHVDLSRLHDPAAGCAKDFVAEWRCGEVSHQKNVPAEAADANLYLSCEDPVILTPTAAQQASGKIAIVAASYGGSCKLPRGNKTRALADACSGKQSCPYYVDLKKLGDPAPGCAKDYVAEWMCGKTVHKTVTPAEAAGVTVPVTCESAANLAAGIKADGKVDVYGLLFDTDKTAIKPGSKATLDEIGALLKSDASLKLEVSGHTDNSGDKAHNMTLSQGRADAVKAALVSQYGIDPGRLITKGYGDTKPVAPNTTEDGKAQNRRVELRKI